MKSEKEEPTSFWVEEQKEPKSGLYQYKNYSTKQFLGYDPNGDYVYTKGQAYGAENWQLSADEQSEGGDRNVVIFADYGKKFLAIVNGKLTGVSTRDENCIWVIR